MDHSRLPKRVSIDSPKAEHCLTEEYPLPAVPGGWQKSVIDLGWTTIDFMVPVTPDALLDLPDVIEANRLDDAMPYWATLWPAATTMSQLLTKADWPVGTEILEVGCGLGLVGIAGLKRGWKMHLTDGEETTLPAARHNAAMNGFPEAAVSLIDWRRPPDRKYPVILACDVLYEVRHHAPLLNLIQTMLEEGGCCWIADPGRTPIVDFVRTAAERGQHVIIRDAVWQICSFPMRGRFQLLELTR